MLLPTHPRGTSAAAQSWTVPAFGCGPGASARATADGTAVTGSCHFGPADIIWDQVISLMTLTLPNLARSKSPEWADGIFESSLGCAIQNSLQCNCAIQSGRGCITSFGNSSVLGFLPMPAVKKAVRL